MSHTHLIPMSPPNRRHGQLRACVPGVLRALWLLLACLVMALPAQAETRAWLDRNAVSLGEAVTLNIQTDQPGVAPDFRPLRADFDLGEPYRGAAGSDGTLFGIVMTPLREGVLEVPGLPVGGEYTEPLRLVVSAASAAAASAPASVPAKRGEVFVETRVDDPAPYVQQSVGLTLRLYYATSLLSGELTQEAPDGASLQRIGDDVQGSREIDGRRYRVLERRYLLVAEHSGPLELPPARFSGQGTGGFFDDLFGSGRGISVQADPLTLQVRAQPDGAPQPWLPLRSLGLRYLTAPDQARAGEAVEIVVEAVAQGATAAQFPEIPVPRVDGAQVFPERAESTERFVDGSPQLTVRRRYSVVPLQPGPLRVAGPHLDWWDTGASQARVASLPDLELEVSAGVAGAVPAPAAAPATPVAVPGDAIALPSIPSAGGGIWSMLALGLAGLWLLTLAGWWWSRRRGGRAPARTQGARMSAGAMSARPALAELRRALDAAGLDEIAVLLQRMADPPAADLDEVVTRLDDPRQRDALLAMRRARWAGEGDPASARAALRTAFRDGPRWRPATAVDAALLPPLYPPR